MNITQKRLVMQVQATLIPFEHQLQEPFAVKTLKTSAQALTIIECGSKGVADILATTDFLLIHN